MKKAFIEKRFTPESRALLVHVMRILTDYDAQGYSLSLRQLYYQLVAANLLPEIWADPKTGSTNNERSYKNIGSLVSDARLAGLIDWDMIKDRGREMTKANHWDTPRDILTASAQQFRIDKWLNQPCYVELMVEKQALEGVLEPVCRELDIPFTANKGYSSSSAMFEAGRRFFDKIGDEKHVQIIYLGDHDPSGIDMTRDIDDRLNQFAEVTAGDDFGITIHRVALNMPQIARLRPPENPAKLTDSRAKDYIRKFGPSSWELDAIEPKALAKLVRDKVAEFRDDELWDDALAREKKMRDELLSFAKKSKFNDE